MGNFHIAWCALRNVSMGRSVSRQISTAGAQEAFLVGNVGGNEDGDGGNSERGNRVCKSVEGKKEDVAHSWNHKHRTVPGILFTDLMEFHRMYWKAWSHSLPLDNELTVFHCDSECCRKHLCALSSCVGLIGAIQHIPRSGTAESKRIPFKIFETCWQTIPQKDCTTLCFCT